MGKFSFPPTAILPSQGVKLHLHRPGMNRDPALRFFGSPRELEHWHQVHRFMIE